jgi:hypothetical protein
MLGFCDLTDEAITAAMCGLDEGWGPGIILKRVAHLPNGDFEDSVSDKSIRPNCVEKLFFCNELTRAPDEMVKHCEGFRPELDYL